MRSGKPCFHAGTTAPRVDNVALNYLPKNVAPEIDDVTVQVGVKYQTTAQDDEYQPGLGFLEHIFRNAF